MTPPVGVVVVIPARDEQGTIRHTLRSVHAAVRRAHRLGLVAESLIHVAAHRCVDRTARAAATYLRRQRCGFVTEHSEASTLGEVRDTAARTALARLRTPPARSWVLSTDADTTVGRDWVVRILEQAAEHDAVGVVGLAGLDRWRGSPAGRAAYDAVLVAKMRSGDPVHQHDHVYGANLAVRADAYLDCGGFARVAHGEDQLLVDTLAAAGHRLLRTSAISVTTSGRLRGRARDGLADHLRRIDVAAARPGTAAGTRASDHERVSP